MLIRIALLSCHFLVGFSIHLVVNSCVQAEETSSSQATKASEVPPSADSLADNLSGKLSGKVTQQSIETWIRELGSSSVDERELAADQLYRSGSIALPLLKQFAKTSDELEVKSRSAAIATAIEKDDLGIRVDQFMRDADITKTYGLECWPSFSKIVGTGRLAKRLFREVIDTYPSFAEDGFADEQRLLIETERIGREILISQRKGEEHRLGQVVTLMYASIRLKEKVPRDIEQTTSTLTRRAPFPQEIQSTALATPLRALFREWIKTATSEPQWIMITCMELGLEDGKDIAKNFLVDKQIGPDLFDVSMACMMRFGTRDDLPWIEPWITDERGLKPPFKIANVPMRQVPIPFGGPGKERIPEPAPVVPKIEEVQVQYRDLALAAGLKIFNEEVALYYPRAQWHPYRGFLAASLTLPIQDSSKRDAVLARWKELRSTHEAVQGESGEKVLPPQEIR